MVDIFETVWGGVCSNKCIIFQTPKETVFLIERYQKIRIPQFVTYLSVPAPLFKNWLYVFLCVQKEKEVGSAKASERNRESERKTERRRECRCTYNHPPFICPNHYLRHWMLCHLRLILYCAAGIFSPMNCQNRSSGPEIELWLRVPPPRPSPPIHMRITFHSTLRERLWTFRTDLETNLFWTVSVPSMVCFDDSGPWTVAEWKQID